MKATLLSLILIYLCVGTLSAQSKIKAKWNGETYYTVLPEAYHVSEIKWNPSEEEIPLSAKRAYDIAKEWMEKHFSDDPYFIHSFQLYNFTPKEEKGTWMWNAVIKNGKMHVKEKREGGSTMYEEESFDLFIRMDGKAFGPSKLKETN